MILEEKEIGTQRGVRMHVNRMHVNRMHVKRGSKHLLGEENGMSYYAVHHSQRESCVNL